MTGYVTVSKHACYNSYSSIHQKTSTSIPRDHKTCLVIARHLSWSQDMCCDHKTCLVITRRESDHKTCLAITGHVCPMPMRHIWWHQRLPIRPHTCDIIMCTVSDHARPRYKYHAWVMWSRIAQAWYLYRGLTWQVTMHMIISDVSKLIYGRFRNQMWHIWKTCLLITRQVLWSQNVLWP